MFAADFDRSSRRAWINCAHQGMLPRCAAEEAREAVAWKQRPWELTQERFDGVPQRLRRALARLLGAEVEQIVLANSASYGLHLIANGYPWKEGDEALVVHGDFPSCVLPWLGLRSRGVHTREVAGRDPLPSPGELDDAIGPRTRVFCCTWVHSFSGWTADLEGLGTVCRDRGVQFVVNASQGLGARPFRVSDAPVDAVTSVGFKWLCGPYGTGVCWLRPELLERLEYNQAYWLASMTAGDLGAYDGDLQLPEPASSGRRYDVFGTANFFNFKPWAAAIEYLLERGLDRVAAWDQALVSRLLDGLDGRRYRVLSPREGAHRSTLVFVSHRESERNLDIFETLRREGVHISYRRGQLRVAPHLFNTEADIDRLLDVLHREA